ncbi:unnamed protein product [Leptidea sinapis]|uniref:Uncharacterized protein n=1 Tax=Leptidea sinapis TaxID=189913 RepID=A0A5E4PQK3_9NEOP|nr:unnamed protein product [Leptidea sinapis]
MCDTISPSCSVRKNKNSPAINAVGRDKDKRRPILKKMILSQKLVPADGGKSISAGIITRNQQQTSCIPREATKSASRIGNHLGQSALDICKRCGDMQSRNKITTNSKTHICNSNNLMDDIKSPKHLAISNQRSIVQQYYKNELYQRSSGSINTCDINKKVSLDTITEQPERSCHNSSDTLFKIYPDSSDDEFLNPNDPEVIQNLKEFRNKNFFECHSVKSRTCSESASVSGSNKHKCIYRFYLNERLFPVPLNTDHHETIRCMECQLPLQYDDDMSTNGMVQAKVKLNNKVQDMMLLLPVKKNLIIKEKRKEAKLKKDLNSMYFGIIKLNINGDSVFHRSLPDNSLALKYQKGYQEFIQKDVYEYDSIKDGDVIII